MTVILRIFGVLSIFAGAVWFFQGIGVLPGSFMTGQIQWAIYGAIAVAVGIGVLVYARRGGASPPD